MATNPSVNEASATSRRGVGRRTRRVPAASHSVAGLAQATAPCARSEPAIMGQVADESPKLFDDLPNCRASPRILSVEARLRHHAPRALGDGERAAARAAHGDQVRVRGSENATTTPPPPGCEAALMLKSSRPRLAPLVARRRAEQLALRSTRRARRRGSARAGATRSAPRAERPARARRSRPPSSAAARARTRAASAAVTDVVVRATAAPRAVRSAAAARGALAARSRSRRRRVARTLPPRASALCSASSAIVARAPTPRTSRAPSSPPRAEPGRHARASTPRASAP